MFCINFTSKDECNCLLLQILAKSRGLDWKATAKLQDVQVKLKLSLEEMLTVVEEVFHPEPYSIEEIGEYLGINSKELRTQVLSQNTQDGECMLNGFVMVHDECLYDLYKTA